MNFLRKIIKKVLELNISSRLPTNHEMDQLTSELESSVNRLDLSVSWEAYHQYKYNFMLLRNFGRYYIRFALLIFPLQIILDHIKPTILSTRDLDILISKFESFIRTLPLSEQALYEKAAGLLAAYRTSIIKMQSSLRCARTSLHKLDNGKAVLVPSVRELILDLSAMRNVGVNQ